MAGMPFPAPLLGPPLVEMPAFDGLNMNRAAETASTPTNAGRMMSSAAFTRPSLDRSLSRFQSPPSSCPGARRRRLDPDLARAE